MHFVRDAPASGEMFRVLTVVDLPARDCVALAARHRSGGGGVGRTLGAAAAERWRR
jgi:hypothetical protein